MTRYVHILFIAFLTLNFGNMFAGVLIRGANGTDVDFVAIFDAKPVGLVALVKPDGTVITVPWDKIDLLHLKAAHPQIHGAYEKALATQTDQPLGLGLAEDMLSLSQLPNAIRQAVKDPYTWPYSNYSYETTYTDSTGRSVTRTQTTRYTQTPTVYSSATTPFIVLRRLKDAQDDSQKKELTFMLKGGGYGTYGINTMLERLDYAVSKLPPAKMFPRDGKTSTLVMETTIFRRKMEEMIAADTLSYDHQAAIKRFFTAINLD